MVRADQRAAQVATGPRVLAALGEAVGRSPSRAVSRSIRTRRCARRGRDRRRAGHSPAFGPRSLGSGALAWIGGHFPPEAGSVGRPSHQRET